VILQCHFRPSKFRHSDLATIGERCQRVQQITGVGPLTADAFVATVGDPRLFANGRQLAAWLGLVPSQHSSGGKHRLGAITCRGDAYLRTLLIQGARSSWLRAVPGRTNTPRLSSAGSPSYAAECRSARCWSPSPTSTPGRCGPCWRAMNPTIPPLGCAIR